MTAASARPCDRGVAGAVVAPAAKRTARPTGTLAAAILGSSLAFIDGSVVNVGLPAIERSLGAGGASISWLINAYLLPLGAVVPLAASPAIAGAASAPSSHVGLGFALFLRLGPRGPWIRQRRAAALALIARGLRLSVAPLTAAAMSTVDAAHVGSASGVNNAVARVAGPRATALRGLVLAGGAASLEFVARFHAAAVAGALAAGAAAFGLVDAKRDGAGRRLGGYRRSM